MNKSGMSFRIVLVLVIAGLLSALAGCSAGTPQQETPKQQPLQLSMGSSSTSSSQYPYAVAIAKIINDSVPGVTVTVLESGTTVENVTRVNSGEWQLATSVGLDEIFAAYNAVVQNEGQPKKQNLRILLMQAANMLPLVVREDSGVKSIYELNGKKFNPGMPGSGTEKKMKLYFEVLGIKPDWFLGSVAEAVDAVKDRKIIGYAKAGAGMHLDASTLDIMSNTKIRLLEWPKEARDKIAVNYPLQSWMEVPKGTIAELPGHEAFWCWAGVIYMIANPSVPADVTYGIIKNVIARKNDIVPVWPDLKEFDIAKQTVNFATAISPRAPFHAGAAKYYLEQGFTLPPDLVPTETK